MNSVPLVRLEDLLAKNVKSQLTIGSVFLGGVCGIDGS
jgi:hypothetical protein